MSRDFCLRKAIYSVNISVFAVPLFDTTMEIVGRCHHLPAVYCRVTEITQMSPKTSFEVILSMFPVRNFLYQCISLETRHLYTIPYELCLWKNEDEGYVSLYVTHVVVAVNCNSFSVCQCWLLPSVSIGLVRTRLMNVASPVGVNRMFREQEAE